MFKYKLQLLDYEDPAVSQFFIMNDKTTTFFYKLPEMLENIFTV